MRLIKTALFLVSVLAVSVTSASAQIANGGFETPVVPVGGFTQFVGGSVIGGAWNVLGNDVLVINTTYSEAGNGVIPFAAQSGIQSLDITGAGNTSPNDGVQQNVSTAIGQAYQLSFFVGRAGGNSLYATPSTVDLSLNGGARIGFTNSNVTPGTVNWQPFSFTFVATTTSTSVAFLNGTPVVGSGGNNFAGLDNVSLITVPEPTTALLLGIPVLAFGIVLRKKVSRLG